MDVFSIPMYRYCKRSHDFVNRLVVGFLSLARALHVLKNHIGSSPLHIKITVLYVFTGYSEPNAIRLNLVLAIKLMVTVGALLRFTLQRVQLSSPRDLANSKYKDSALIGSRGALGSPPIKEYRGASSELWIEPFGM